MRKHRRDFLAWQNSIEGILYDLFVIPPTASRKKGQPDPELLIAKTLHNLPKRIRERVLEKVVFVAMAGSNYGQVQRYLNSAFLSKGENTDMIFLNFAAMQAAHRSLNYQMTTIAHEIAHYVCGHWTGLVTGGREAEIKADDLCEKWGFGRAYRSYSQFPSKTKSPKTARKINIQMARLT